MTDELRQAIETYIDGLNQTEYASRLSERVFAEAWETIDECDVRSMEIAEYYRQIVSAFAELADSAEKVRNLLSVLVPTPETSQEKIETVERLVDWESRKV